MPRYPDAQCPLRPGDPCTLCQVNVTGPQDCGLVYLVMHDEELMELYRAQRRTRRPHRLKTLVPEAGKSLAAVAGNR